MPCPSDIELLALIEGRLPVTERSAAESHLDACHSCLAIVAALARESASGLREHRSAAAPELALAAPGPLLGDGAPRYVPGPEIARGGMGRILAADDRLLGRRVALKLLRRPGADFARRLRREQRITARLQHPAIVPIYDAGTLDDGEPFFAMRLVTGQSLDQAANEARSLDQRLGLLPAVLGIVDAIAYAHGEGVIHRDLKPQNVLVGPFGEVVVLDWGLARELGREDAEPSGGAPDAEPSGGAPDAGPHVTRDGAVLGTLAYMAPEQVAGRAVDARADVYGLGAILYHVLAGAPPHAGRSASLSTGAVRHAPEPIERRVPDAPPDLVTIVDRALAPDPEDRYASALELAEELKRWQAGRLVQAHRYTAGDLVRRFVRRHRAAVLVSVAALLALGVLGGAGLRRVLAERSRAEAALIRAEVARDRAEAQQVAAEGLVAFILGDLRERLERVGRLDALGSAAQAVIAYQDRAPPAEDAAAWIRRSKAAGLSGDVALATGDLGAAEEAYRRGQRAAEQAVATGGGDDALAIQCRAEQRKGDLLKTRGELDDAVAAYEACVAIAVRREDAAFRELLIKSRISLAEVARMRNDLAGSQQLLEETRAPAEALVREAEGRKEYALMRVKLHYDLGRTLLLSGKIRAADDEMRSSLSFARTWTDAHPDEPDGRQRLLSAQLGVAMVEETVGDLAAAERAYREALSDARALAARDPSNVQWQRGVGVAADRLGNVMMTRGDFQAALEWLRESDASSARMVALQPGNLDWQRDLGISAMTLGDVFVKLGRLDEARTSMRRAVEVNELLLGRARDPAQAEHDLGVVLPHLGEVELKAHNLPAARSAFERSIELLRRRLAAEDTPQIRHELAAVMLGLGTEAEHGAVARRHIEEARTLLEPLRSMTASNKDLADLIKEADQIWARTAPPRGGP